MVFHKNNSYCFIKSWTKEKAPYLTVQSSSLNFNVLCQKVTSGLNCRDLAEFKPCNSITGGKYSFHVLKKDNRAELFSLSIIFLCVTPSLLFWRVASPEATAGFQTWGHWWYNEKNWKEKNHMIWCCFILHFTALPKNRGVKLAT